MKSLFQTLSFLSNYTPKTALDAEFINSFLVQRFQITPKTPRFAPNFDAKLLDVPMFISWYESGLEAFKMARFKNKLIILGNCTLESCNVIGVLDANGSINTTNFSILPEEVSEASKSEEQLFKQALLENRLQPDPNTMKLAPKFTPQLSNRVIFYDFAQEVQGVGVVREITAEGNVIFFCYFTYPTYSRPKMIGYNLHETPGYDLQSFIFESIDRENVPSTLGNSTSCFRRLGRELEKVGKVWKDKLLRIEPTNIELKVGSKYYYISDKMKVVTETEKGTPTSRIRYLAGNYFMTHMAATKMLGKFNDLLRGYLASEKWPEIED